MRTQIRALSGTTIVVLAVALAGCASGGGQTGEGGGDSRVFRVAFNQNADHPQAQAILALSDKLEEATDGRYSLELFPDGTLGAQEATIEQVQSGTIDFALVAGSLLESFSSDFSVVNLPYLYESPEHQMEVLNDPEIVGDLYATLEEDNIQTLAAFHGGVRNVYASKAIETPDDLAGAKIRVIGSETNVRMMELMGGVGTPMAQDEVYTAIQSGVLDGAENNELIYSSLSHDEISPFYSSTQHLMMPDYLISSPSVWNGLDEETREIFQDLLDEAVDDELEAFADAVEAAKSEAEDAGATFVESDVDAFREAVLPLHDEKVTTPLTESVYEAITAARG
ncbi:MAG: C4-dicarboxylate transporter substrate-binding protein [Microbacterium sp.]|jgi:tripartite ATP-independent transporter DctP family solute receptor|uniref:TRAP transporter substrate-binding protein n=1 Tax=Microbacterium sp. TaxID=51671 RepID=UPI00260395DA|nr:TRAP transporter substrate-binding protein [Microbacterium sp.]MDF2491969.1 C4-dicarboxylate transporter substrate-binding protein [Microbacterium sp.]MDF2563057.1 C4-dicarboxylate transporter substrate-binding protein [Microbacterium sp.]